MIGLLIGGFIGAMIVLYAADLIMKARSRARRVRRMSERLAAVTVRAEKQQEQQQAAVQASKELTSFLPAINCPPGDPAHRSARPRTGREHTGPHDRVSARPGRRRSRTGENSAAGSGNRRPRP